MNASRQIKNAQETRKKNIFRSVVLLFSFLVLVILLIKVNGHKEPFEEMYNDCYTGVVNNPDDIACSVHIEDLGIYTKDDLDKIVGRWSMIVSFLSILLFINIIAISYIGKIFFDNQNLILELEIKEREHRKLTKKEEHRKYITSEAKDNEKAGDYDSAIQKYEGLGEFGQSERVKTLKAEKYEKAGDYDSAIRTWKELRNTPEYINNQIRRVKTLKAEKYEKDGDYDSAIRMWKDLGNTKDVERIRKHQLVIKAKQREEALDYDAAIEVWEKLGNIKEAARVRKLVFDSRASKTVVHGDYVDDRDTIVKDSVLNRSNIGGTSKMQELKELKELHNSGTISDDEFEEMKKEIMKK